MPPKLLLTVLVFVLASSLSLLCAVADVKAAGIYDDNPEQAYESKGGARYQYDLNRPADQLKYQYDYKAQFRDQVDSLRPDPVRDLKEDLYGQKGGGIYRKER